MTQGGFSVAVAQCARTGAGAFAASLFANAARSARSGECRGGGGAPEPWRVSASARLPPDLGGTGFAAIDSNGQAATCAVTLNGAFGAAHSAGTSGVVLANAPSTPAGIAGAFLTPMIARDGDGRSRWRARALAVPMAPPRSPMRLLKLAAGQRDRPARRFALHRRGTHGDGQCDFLPECLCGACPIPVVMAWARPTSE